MSSKPTTATIEQQFHEILIQELGVDQDEINPDARLVEDLGADSLDQVELVLRCEEDFGIEISDEDAERITTVGQAVDYLERRVNGFIAEGEQR